MGHKPLPLSFAGHFAGDEVHLTRGLFAITIIMSELNTGMLQEWSINVW